jgi:hypothetical protein
LIFKRTNRIAKTMNRKRFAFAILVPLFAVAAVVSSSACGTFANLSREREITDERFSERNLSSKHEVVSKVPVPFGGILYDLPFVENPSRLQYFGSPNLLDLPFSIAMDVVTLPYVLWVMFGDSYHRSFGRIPLKEKEVSPSETLGAFDKPLPGEFAERK